MSFALGHVIYEMSCRGQQLKTALPDNEDYRSVSDTSVSKVLKFIFEQVETRHDHRHIISKVNYFFTSQRWSECSHSQVIKIEIRDMYKVCEVRHHCACMAILYFQTQHSFLGCTIAIQVG